jgi:CheY-like chemotaxis protein
VKKADIIQKQNTGYEPNNKEFTILIVDDEEIIRKMVKKMVEKHGFQALVAYDGENALEIFKTYKDQITCVLLDLTMPNLDGMTTFSKLKEISPNVKVILSSGYNQQEITDRYVSKGLSGFLQKPYEMDTLIKTLLGVCCDKNR